MGGRTDCTPSDCGPDRMDPLLTQHWPGSARLVLRNLLAILMVVETVTGLGGLSTGYVVLSLGLMALVVAAATSFTHRRIGDWKDIVAMCLMVGAGAGLNVLTGHTQVYLCGYTAVFVAMYWYRLPWSLIPASLGVVAVGLSTAYVGRYDPLGGLGQAAGALGLGTAMAFRRRAVRANWRNRELSDELRDSREAEQRNAIAAERARLAREFHDVLAHTLSSLSLHLESTRVLAKSRDVDAEVLERIDRAVALARTGLVEARDAVGTLRDDALPGPARLPALVADFERDTGLTVHFAQTGTPGELAAEARVAVFRAAQEALTNVVKHAHATEVDVSFAWQPHEAVLRVSDNGQGAETPRAAGAGNGLRGMRERAELAGGSVSAGPGDTGYVVEVRLPLVAASVS
ncbi:MAG TPA: sensor histidine kinase [Mycobacteriales bacterium]|nr:sensor histidine kinase [Mycobacteriales bacterium]